MACVSVFCFVYAFVSSALASAVDLENYDLIIIPWQPNPRPSLRALEKSLEDRFAKSFGEAISNSDYHANHKRLDVEAFRPSPVSPEIDEYETSTVNPERDEYDYGSFSGERIVGGTQVDINLYPYHVAYGDNCAGAIIDKKWVITAAHCNKKSTFIKAGSKHIHKGKKVKIKEHYIHPLWGAKNKEHPFDYDFQLLELAEPLSFDDNIQSLKIAHIEDMVVGKIITVTGWGNIEENGPYSNVLRAVRIPIISKSICQSVPFPYFRGTLSSRMFCAGFAEEKKDACQGDSGGPAVSDNRLLGMVSFGYGCATPGSYGVYSKVAKVRPWIEEVTGLKLD
ncbi:trypsin-1 [Bombyx mori]|uniref:trypsin-1 n=1 Tax=Bombyx mori TaxID=7091 RepID=UPI002ED2CC71